MTDSTSSGGTVDVSIYNFQRACYRGGRSVSWGTYTESVVTKSLGVGRQLVSIMFWSNYVQIGIFRNNTSAVQEVLLRAKTYYWTGVVSDKYFISAVTFGEDEVFNPPFVNVLLNLKPLEHIPLSMVDDYLDYCQIRRMYELTSPVLTTATVTEIRIPYSYLSWFAMDVERRIYNDDGSLKDDYSSDNNMFSDYEN